MKKFMIIGLTTDKGYESMKDITAEDRKNSMDAWMAWKEKVGGALLDMGAPLISGKKVNEDGSVGDKESDVSGYMTIQAETMEDALALMKASPLGKYKEGHSFEVFEMMQM